MPLSDLIKPVDSSIAQDRADYGDQYDIKINDLRNDVIALATTVGGGNKDIIADTSSTTATAGKGIVVGSGNEGLVEAQNPAAMSVKVTVGGIAYNNAGTRIEFAAKNPITIDAADNANARWDIVVVYSDGTILVRKGTPAGSPADPTLTNGDVPLARIVVDANAANIASNKITDLRSRTYVDGGKINDGSITTAKLANNAVTGVKIKKFTSTEIIGNGSNIDTAHGLGYTPTFVSWSISAGDGNAFTVVPGAHDATNIKINASAGTKYYITAF